MNVAGVSRASAVAAVIAGAFVGGTGPVSASDAVAAESRQASSCALTIEWRGREYVAYAVRVSPRAGRRLVGAVHPPCEETPPDDLGGHQTPAAVRAIRGVRPHDAFVEVGRPDVVFVRASLERVPNAVRRLESAPRCETAGPVRLAGSWLGVRAPNGGTEDDLVPPYDLKIHVRWASKSRYERAFLNVRATQRTQGLITREDVEKVLWTGGDLRATVRCVRGRYVAVRLDARPT